ncbi:DUF4105 domain-containing protein [Leptospira sp. 2 VSF19]|uniref:DUF4105 domain-containing protein n=1 Tax=Leptospira soteropolitanensis TaxID=2950025 RepID=A0AAW5VQP0_9LEPT|nr:DUF4105 domain-containing protein [Leptospira soteropolitanensis]MCW7494358.1 DUF4105 domain-containing protein [Leptospira soteropolitanensis]MCW7501933.1 DUF4105 domain-containing protein [Leptospira soteropolitanensis]MCW7524204.1 DUF4105 domain-containing protein [Leptospira soteropolitanensis]MCW7528069.1 DUF4105 domain-containing protein [Leptospira soteropolitanensis]MCW7531923.1 DUF4105 domain-containing protein [Leptospira soteropolitanensis]
MLVSSGKLFILKADPLVLETFDLQKTKEWGRYQPNSPENSHQLTELLLQSDKLRLYEDVGWIQLLHYEKKGEGKFKSEVNSERFFFDPKGRVNPRAELEATIRSFFVTEAIPDSLLHPLCSYPARYNFLKKHLFFEFFDISKVRCDRYKNWKNSLQVNSVSIVFASYYLQSPASYFGHTLLKLNQNANAISQSEILDYGLNYAADAQSINPISYAYFGLTGGYQGKFYLFPYYLKVNEYNDLENRDLWEYEIRLNEEEVDILISHLWELSRAEFHYYFLNKNCSYQLMELLEVAKPNLDLKSKLGIVVSPVDTIKFYLSTKDLISEKKFRPSLYTEIKSKLLEMNAEEKEIFWALTDFSNTRMEVNRLLETPNKIRSDLILDAVLETYRYQKNRGVDFSESAKLSYKQWLNLRSQIKEENLDYKLNFETSFPPESSHPMGRVSLGSGYSNLGSFVEWKYRLAYHDLLNSSKGSTPNGELVFFDGAVRNYEGKRPEFSSLSIMRILSLQPYNSISKQLSYLFDFGWQTTVFTKEKDYFSQVRSIDDSNPYYRKQVSNIDVGVGYTLADEFSKSSPKFGVFSLLAGGKFQSHPSFETGSRFGPNVQGIYQKELGNWKILGSLIAQHYTFSRDLNVGVGSLKLRYLFSDTAEFRLELFSERLYREFNLSFHYLF